MTHMNVSLAQELADELVRTVPRRKRSAFVAAAIAEKIARERQMRDVLESAGVWSDEGRGDAATEVRQLREAWGERSGAEE